MTSPGGRYPSTRLAIATQAPLAWKLGKITGQNHGFHHQKTWSCCLHGGFHHQKGGSFQDQTDIVQSWRDGTKEPLKQHQMFSKKRPWSHRTWVLPTRNWDQSHKNADWTGKSDGFWLTNVMPESPAKRLNIPESNRRTGAGCRSFLRSEFLDVGILEVSENREPKSVMA